MPETGLPGRGNNRPVCFRGAVDGGEYVIEDADGKNSTGVVDIAVRVQVGSCVQYVPSFGLLYKVTHLIGKNLLLTCL